MVTTAMRCFLLSRRRRAPRPVGAVSVVPRWTGWPPRLTPAARTHPGVGRDRGERAVMRACEVVPLAWDATGSVRDRPQWKRTGHRLSTGREFTVGDQVVRRHLAGMNLIPKLLATIALSLTTTPIASAAPPPPAAWPLQPRPEVVRGFELPAKPWLPGHRGIDLLGAPGQPVLAATSGTIIAHLSAAGSHCSPRACLHWGLIQGEQYLNPLTLLPRRPVRLLPLVGNAVPLTIAAATTRVAQAVPPDPGDPPSATSPSPPPSSERTGAVVVAATAALTLAGGLMIK